MLFKKENIRALFIFEILGRPPEHIKKALEQIIEKLGEQKGIKIERRIIHEPKPLEKKDAKDLFTTFAEVEAIVDNLDLMFKIVLNMLPSNVEILEPTELRMKNFELSPILSELTTKLHRYDEIAKALVFERGNLIKQIQELQGDIEPVTGENTSNAIKEAKEDDKAPAKKTSKKKKRKNNGKHNYF